MRCHIIYFGSNLRSFVSDIFFLFLPFPPPPSRFKNRVSIGKYVEEMRRSFVRLVLNLGIRIRTRTNVRTRVIIKTPYETRRRSLGREKETLSLPERGRGAWREGGRGGGERQDRTILLDWTRSRNNSPLPTRLSLDRDDPWRLHYQLMIVQLHFA